ncbi:unnamed protein product [Calypogeia fissa]
MAASRLLSGMVGLMAATLVFGLLSIKAVSAGTTYSIRWTVPFNMEGLPLGGAAPQPFHQTTLNVSDSIRFEFDSMRDDLLLVSSPSFLECNSSDPIHYWANGNTTITFSTPGEFHYISGLPRHCLAGQFLLVTVVDSSTTIPPPKPSDSDGSEASTDQTTPDDESQNIKMTGSKIEARHDESILNVHPTSVLASGAAAGAKVAEKDLVKKDTTKEVKDTTTKAGVTTAKNDAGSGGNVGGHDQKKDGNTHPSPGMHGSLDTKKVAHDSIPQGSAGGAGGNTHPSPGNSGHGHPGGTNNDHPTPVKAVDYGHSKEAHPTPGTVDGHSHPTPGKVDDHGHSIGAHPTPGTVDGHSHPTPGKVDDHGHSNVAHPTPGTVDGHSHPTPGKVDDHGHSNGAHPTPGTVDGLSKESHQANDGHQVSQPNPVPDSRTKKIIGKVGKGFQTSMEVANKVGDAGLSYCGSTPESTGISFRCQPSADNTGGGSNADQGAGGMGGGDVNQGGGNSNFQGGGNFGTNQPGQGTDPHAAGSNNNFQGGGGNNNFQGGGNFGTNQPGQGTDAHAAGSNNNFQGGGGNNNFQGGGNSGTNQPGQGTDPHAAGSNNNFQGGGNFGTNQPGQGTDQRAAGSDQHAGVNTYPSPHHGSTPTF